MSGTRLAEVLQNFTAADLQRDYSPEHVRLLCLRTKVRVKMTKLNCVWDAKKRLMSKGLLANRSERFINAVLVAAVTEKMVEPYTDEEVAAYNIIKKRELKTLNNIRLERYKREREDEATTSEGPTMDIDLSVEDEDDDLDDVTEMWGMEDQDEFAQPTETQINEEDTPAASSTQENQPLISIC